MYAIRQKNNIYPPFSFAVTKKIPIFAGERNITTNPKTS